MGDNQQNTNLKKPYVYSPFIYLLITIIIVAFVVFLLAQINPDIYMILLIWVSILFVPVILPPFLILIFWWPKKSNNQVQNITQEQIIYNKNKKLALLIPIIFLGVVSVVMLIYIVLVSFLMPD